MKADTFNFNSLVEAQVVVLAKKRRLQTAAFLKLKKKKSRRRMNSKPVSIKLSRSHMALQGRRPTVEKSDKGLAAARSEALLKSSFPKSYKSTDGLKFIIRYLWNGANRVCGSAAYTTSQGNISSDQIWMQSPACCSKMNSGLAFRFSANKVSVEELYTSIVNGAHPSIKNSWR